MNQVHTIAQLGPYARIIEGTHEGAPFRAFECIIDPDDPDQLEYMYPMEEMDPRIAEELQRIHNRQIRRIDRAAESDYRTEPKMISLGHRANKVSAGAARRRISLCTR